MISVSRKWRRLEEADFALTHRAELTDSDLQTSSGLKLLVIYLAFALAWRHAAPVIGVEPASTQTPIRPRALPSSQRWLQV